MSEYSVMAVNERLFVTGLIGEWDQAVQRKDREKLIADYLAWILCLVGFNATPVLYMAVQTQLTMLS